MALTFPVKAGDRAKVANLSAVRLEKYCLKTSTLHMISSRIHRLERLGISKVCKAYQVHCLIPSVDMTIITGLGHFVNGRFVNFL
jgi:hypothetical protein